MSTTHDIVSVTFDRDDRSFTISTSRPTDRFWSDDRGQVRKVYDYRAPKGLLLPGDQAVVDSPYGTAVVTVRLVNGPSAYRGALKTVVCKVDRSAHRRALAEQIDDLRLRETEARKQATKFAQEADRLYTQKCSLRDELQALAA